MNNAQYYSILYEKILMDHLGLIVYRPLEVIEGQLVDDGEQKLFITANGETFYLNVDSRILNEDIKLVVGNVLPKILVEKTLVNFNEDQRRDFLYQDTFNQLIFGMYINEFNKIELSSVDLNNAYSQMYVNRLMEENPEKYHEMVLEEEKKYLKNKIGFNQTGKQDLVDPFKKKNTIGFINEPREDEENTKPKKKIKIGFQL